MDFIKTVLKDADDIAVRCDLTKVRRCYKNIGQQIREEYVNGKPKVEKCILDAGITLTPEAFNAIEESLINSTMSAVAKVVAKRILEKKKAADAVAAPTAPESTPEPTAETSETDATAPAPVANTPAVAAQIATPPVPVEQPTGKFN